MDAIRKLPASAGAEWVAYRAVEEVDGVPMVFQNTPNTESPAQMNTWIPGSKALWIAENVGTAAGAWIYPHQQEGWHLVPLSKLVSWLLLMMVSVVLVTLVHRPRGPEGTQ